MRVHVMFVQQRHIFGEFVVVFLVWVRARSRGFRFPGFSAWFWLLGFLGFLVFRFLASWELTFL